MLNKHLLVEFNPIADSENIIFYKKYRITVLFDRLFRIEKNTDGGFCDNATQSIWCRNTPRVDYSVFANEDFMEIKTKRITLHIEDSIESSYVVFDGVRIAINNEENLLGTTRTLDKFNGEYHCRNNFKLKLGYGVCSRSGVAVIDDTESLRLLDGGKLIKKSSDEFDIYVFAYGGDYRAAVKALYTITGYPPLLPRFAFGNWWSRYHEYTDEEYLSLMDTFERYGIPLTVATVDMDWHYSNNLDEQKQITKSGKKCEEKGTVTNYPMGWTGYSWNKDLFPDYKAFLRELQKRNLKVTLNLHPADGVRYFEDMYPEMAIAMGIDPKSEKVVKFDIADDRFINNYFDILHHPYEKDGVDFWWIDWQQGVKSSMEGLDPLWALNHYHYYDNARDGKNALIMSRYCGVGSHRYPIGFSGDTLITWSTLAYMPYFTSTSANIGYTWWGHDIGGHFDGVKDDELYLRFLQFGVFNPINRLHCANTLMLTKEPWTYKNGIGELAREAMKLRHRMIPYLHTANYRTHKLGIGLVEPMYYDYPNAEDAYEASGQYIFASDLIVCPIAEHTADCKLSLKNVWLPRGKWTDIFTGEIYNISNGGEWIKTVRSLDSIPVFAKEGAVIPYSNDQGNSTSNPKELEVEIYNGNNKYELYEDDENGSAAYTVFENIYSHGIETIKFKTVGDASVLPENRCITFTFKNIVVNTPVDAAIGIHKGSRFANITVLKNGKPVEFEVSKYDTVRVTVRDIDYFSQYEIRVEYSELSDLESYKRDILMKLLNLEGPFTVRNRLDNSVRPLQSCEELKSVIINSELQEIQKTRLSETFNHIV